MDEPETRTSSPRRAEAAAAPAPSWAGMATRPDDVPHCPLCEYDLRGLTEPRCPECGYRFTWEELRDPRRRVHPYLFEHHPERNVSSYFQTLIGGLVPAEFWSTLYPTQPSRPARLLAYWLIAAAPLALVTAAYGWRSAKVATSRVFLFGTPPRGPVEVARWVMKEDVEAGAPGLLALMLLAWPWLTLAALLVFRISMRRARLKSTHVLRCVLYAGDVCLWVVPPAGLLMAVAWVAPQSALRDMSGFIPLAGVAVGFWLWYRLYPAYQFYLRFEHAFATVLASQVIVLLVYWKSWLFAQGY